jgi:hypothetical protein
MLAAIRQGDPPDVVKPDDPKGLGEIALDVAVRGS